MVSDLFMPPGTAPVPWMRLPEVMRMTSCPNLRNSTPRLAISGCSAATPTILRRVTSLALNEFFKAPEFDDVQANLMHLVMLVEQDGDLAVALDPGDGINGNATQSLGMFSGFEGISHRATSIVMH